MGRSCRYQHPGRADHSQTDGTALTAARHRNLTIAADPYLVLQDIYRVLLMNTAQNRRSR